MLSNFQIFPFKYYRYDIAAKTYSLSEAYSFYVGPIPQFFLHPFINLVIFNFLFVKIVFYFPNILQILHIFLIFMNILAMHNYHYHFYIKR